MTNPASLALASVLGLAGVQDAPGADRAEALLAQHSPCNPYIRPDCGETEPADPDEGPDDAGEEDERQG